MKPSTTEKLLAIGFRYSGGAYSNTDGSRVIARHYAISYAKRRAKKTQDWALFDTRGPSYPGEWRGSVLLSRRTLRELVEAMGG